jgi:hypothetical protein
VFDKDPKDLSPKSNVELRKSMFSSETHIDIFYVTKIFEELPDMIRHLLYPETEVKNNSPFFTNLF